MTWLIACADQKVRGGATLTTFIFLVWWGEEKIQIQLLAGYHRSASETPFKWRFAGVPMMAQLEFWLGSFVILRGSGPVLLRNPIFLWFQAGPGPPVPTLWIRKGHCVTLNKVHCYKIQRESCVLRHRQQRHTISIRHDAICCHSKNGGPDTDSFQLLASIRKKWEIIFRKFFRIGLLDSVCIMKM